MAWHRGEWLPIYVPEWYFPRVSQHMFDPYSFTHILHGLFFYYLLFLWGCDDLLFGAGLTFIAEFVHEVAENSSIGIRMYRQTSGTSQRYTGDSLQNIAGDIIACMFGYFIAAYFVAQGVWWMAVVWALVWELGLILYMRDSLVLILIQLAFNTESIKNWQAEIVPDTGKLAENQKHKPYCVYCAGWCAYF